MSRVLNFAIVALATVFVTMGQAQAAVVNVSEGSTNGYTMANGNTYVIRNSASFSNATVGGNGMTVEDDATVVLYVPAGITLTATGANGSGRIGGGAGIYVPSNSTLIVTGEGTIIATGGNAGNGENGVNGADGDSISTRDWWATDNNSVYYAISGTGCSGKGGNGGDGGGGAAAGIGGSGGDGGIGGSGGWAHLGNGPAQPRTIAGGDGKTYNFSGNGENGNEGLSGNAASSFGRLYVLGKSAIFAREGEMGRAGFAGTNGAWTCHREKAIGACYAIYYYFATSGGGGGGGGGAGCAPVCGIGGGGASGGGGGGGGSGATASTYRTELTENAHGGGGAGGGSTLYKGEDGNTNGVSVSAIGNCSGGDGGEGGLSGTDGAMGTLYVSPTATVDVERETLSATTHPSAQYTITFDANGGLHLALITSLTTTLGCELPDCISTPTRNHYLFSGWRTADGEEYYGATGDKSISAYPVASNVVLYAQWKDKTATPTLNPADGSTFVDNTSVAISVETAGAKIYYTLDGTTPTTNSIPYKKKFRIYGKTTVKAIAYLEESGVSDVATANYALGYCTTPTVTPTGGTTFHHSGREVSIDWNEDDGTLYYTLDGSEPTTNSFVYDAPFTIDETTTIKAKVFSDKYFDSDVVTTTLVREWLQVAKPTIAVSETFTGSKTWAEVSCATDGAVLYYTVDGSEPTTNSAVCTAVVCITNSCVLKVLAVCADYLDSEIASFTITKTWGIGDALNMPDQVFTSSGDAFWASYTNVTHDGVESLRSGAIDDNQTSTFSTTFTGMGTVSFWWRTSCEDSGGYYDYDHIEFSADGTVYKLDGITEWQKIEHTFDTEGEHALIWTYSKDDSEYQGEDCAWVDELLWKPKGLDPIPDLGNDPTDAQVIDTMSSSADKRLSQYVTNGTEYVAYRSWATNVQQMVGGLAGTQAVHDSPHAWLSYALDSSVLVTNAPVQGEMKIASFGKNATTGRFDFLVAVDGMTVGAKAVPERMATLFSVEGCGTVDGEYLSENVSFGFGTPSEGKVTISVLPNDENATQFFIKAKMKP